ncbi:hypothetical protein [Cellulosilyticum ruminicola]|uniref:hypothetical protein n=1 Tax=Cellulosilyticum ruminicola TaxID=425254 RepID=UPI0012ED1AF3|nr:hypothetical protein [Cellulosilyticum ruminicola]
MKNVYFISNHFNKNKERIYFANTVRSIWINEAMHYICVSRNITCTMKLKKQINKINL